MDESTMEPLDYILSHLYWLWLLFLIFSENLYRPILSSHNGIALAASSRIFYLLIALFVIVGLLVTIRRNRTHFRVALNVLSPFGAYLILEMLPDFPLWFWVVTLAVVLFVTYQIADLIFRPVRRDRVRAMLRRTGQLLHSVHLLLMLLLAGFTLACLAASVFGISLVDRNYAPRAAVSGEVRDHEEELQPLRPEYWETLDTQGRLDVLRVVLDIETAYLGLPDRIVLVSEELEESVAGSYDHRERKIRIDVRSLNESAEQCVWIVLHETRHSYQHYLIWLYETLDESYQDLIGVRDAAQYLADFSDYIGVEGDQERYENQFVERDAEAYALSRFESYNFLFMNMSVLPEEAG